MNTSNKPTKNSQDLGISRKDLERYNPFAAFERQRNWERGYILEVDVTTYTCDVYTERGKVLVNVPWPSNFLDSSGAAGDITVPKRLQKVIVNYNLGEPRIIASDASLVTAVDHEYTITGTTLDSGSDEVSTGRPNYRGARPKDIVPGDWVRLGSGGNFVAVLEGGVSILHGSSVAQVITSAEDDTVRIISRNFDLLSDFGEVKISNEDGRTNLSLRGGAQQLDETSPQVDDNFSIHADLGAVGDVVDFRITDPRGVLKYRNHVDPDGNNTVVTASLDIQSSEDTEHIISGSAKTEIGGDKSEDIAGSVTTNIDGNKNETALGTNTVSAGQLMSLLSGGSMTLSSGETLSVVAAGKTTPKPSDSAVKFSVVNGSVIFDIGKPSLGDKITGRSGFKVSTTNGPISLKTLTAGIALDSPKPDSIVLGGQTASMHVMIYENFVKYLEILGSYIDSHTHGSAVGPTTPPVPPPYQTSMGTGRTILESSRSRIVKIRA